MCHEGGRIVDIRKGSQKKAKSLRVTRKKGELLAQNFQKVGILFIQKLSSIPMGSGLGKWEKEPKSQCNIINSV